MKTPRKYGREAIDRKWAELPADQLAHEGLRQANRLAKWRAVYTGRIAGTRTADDPVAIGYRDLFEKVLLMRAELNAVTSLLLDAGLINPEYADRAFGREYEQLADALADVFPGMTATDEGINLHLPDAAEAMKGWPA